MNSPDRSDATLKKLKQGLGPLSVLLLVLLGHAAGSDTALAAEGKRTVPADRPVSYEAFGAVGDGVADDLPAIVEAHAFANAHGLSVVARPGATYHLGRRALTALIATDTDWGTARFTINDTDVENHRTSLFAVRSLLEPVTLSIPRLTRDQRRLDVRPPRDCWVRVENDRQRCYLRRGLNQNNGSTQRDCFILRRDGTIEGAIDWDYDTITRVEAHPLDDRPLILKGGVFTTTANRMKQAKGYNYWARNIAIHRSNTTVVGLTYLLNASNDGQHDFGYPCFMPREILIDGLVIDDQQHPNDYAGPYLFTDPDGGAPSTATRPFPYRLTERVTLRNLTTTSGRKPRISPDPAFAASVRVTELK